MMGYTMRLSSFRCPVVGDLVLLASSGGGEFGKKTQTVALATQADVDAKRFGMRDVVGFRRCGGCAVLASVYLQGASYAL